MEDPICDIAVWLSYRNRVFLDAEERAVLDEAMIRLQDLGERIMDERVTKAGATQEAKCGKI